MELNVINSGTLTVSDQVFDTPFNEALIHQTVVCFLARARQGSKAQLNRSDVRGGGAKPWKQKGTGRARAGTRRSPLWRSGGKTFAASPRDHSKKLNKKMYRQAMRSILSELRRCDRIIVLDQLDIEKPKTKLMVEKMRELKITRGLLVVEQPTDNLILSMRNIAQLSLCEASEADPVSLISHDHIIMTTPSIKKFEELLS